MVAEIIINNNSRALNKTFDYNIPKVLEQSVKIGTRVYIKFGNYKKIEEGYVVNLKSNSEFKLKDIERIENDKVLEEKIELAKWMSEHYFCNISECIKLMLQPGTTTKNIDNRIKEKGVYFVNLCVNEQNIFEEIQNGKIKTVKQIAAIKFLLENGETKLSDFETRSSISKDVVKRLEQKGYVKIEKGQVVRNPLENKIIKKSNNLELNDEQNKAYKQIEKAIDQNQYNEFLLFGVTGSGKTEIYIQLINKVLKQGKKSIMLVPEISLTPQMVDRFISRFGKEQVAILHSKLSVGERFDEWNRIKSGEAKIIIGARSAIFAPVEELGIIIIDEEHDNSYKSETSPRYNVKEVATYMAKNKHIPIVLGSATPDISTYYKTQDGEISLLELTKRANNSKLPNIDIIDLKEELRMGNRSVISSKLKEEIEKNITNKEQTILFLNRRGFSTFIMCRDCGHVVKCKNCNITLTYHIKQDKLRCHYCGYESKSIKICPQCNSENIRYFGMGTQKLEQEINKIFPQAKILRMDVDTVTKKNSHEKIINSFKNDDIDILIGTQMVVKGHHFPRVSLVGVISADSNLNIEDYRAEERTFQTLTQVAGRAGRENNEGRVIIQTYNPENYSIQYSKDHNYKELYSTEINIRKHLKYPPFCDIVVIGVSGEKEKNVVECAKNLYLYLKNRIKEQNIPIILYPFVPAPIDRIKNKIRWRIIVKCKLNNSIINELNNMLDECYNKKNTNTKVIIDVNPVNMN